MGGGRVAVAASIDIGAELVADGYAIVPGTAYRLPAGCRDGLSRLGEACRALPPDRYLADGGNYRFRRYSAFRVSADTVTVEAHRPYYQPVELNLFAGGVRRRLAPLDLTQQRNRFLTAMLRFNVARLAAVSNVGDWHVDVHLVRVVALPDAVGRPSPEGPHRDGFDFVSIHLIKLAGPAAGAISEVIRPDSTTVDRVRLAEPLDSLYLDDRALLHHVTPLRATGGRAHRDVLLMSYQRAAQAVTVSTASG